MKFYPQESMSDHKRYREDPMFKAIVDNLRAVLHCGQLTSHDVARAAVLACELHAIDNGFTAVVVLHGPEPEPLTKTRYCELCRCLHLGPCACPPVSSAADPDRNAHRTCLCGADLSAPGSRTGHRCTFTR
jgi:hypothetical protein